MKKFLIFIFIVALLAGGGYFAYTKLKPETQDPYIKSIIGVKDEYIIDEPFISDNYYVKILYNDNSTKSVHVSDLEIQGFDTSELGTKNITISYNDLEWVNIYTVKYKDVYINNNKWIPTTLLVDGTYNLDNYELIGLTYYDEQVHIPLSSSYVTVENFSSSVSNLTTYKNANVQTAKISICGFEFTHNYRVWFTPYNKSFDIEETYNNVTYSLNSFKILDNGKLTGVLMSNNGDRFELQDGYWTLVDDVYIDYIYIYVGSTYIGKLDYLRYKCFFCANGLFKNTPFSVNFYLDY